uniref:F-box domain-containing protein n=1 Tax=Caenorhabditis tropicalis TaxID=1561998 RepID=A0A1I7T292_9PELO
MNPSHFPLLKLPYVAQKEVIDVSDLSKIVSLAFYNKNIRSLVEKRKNETVKIKVTHNGFRSEVEVQFEDGSIMDNRFISNSPFRNRNLFRIGEYYYHLSSAPNYSIIYIGESQRLAISVFIDSLIQMFISSKIDMKIAYDLDLTDNFYEYESSLYLNNLEVNLCGKHLTDFLELYETEKIFKSEKKKLIPNEIYLQDESMDEWLDEVMTINFRKLTVKSVIREKYHQNVNSLLIHWKSGGDLCFRHLTLIVVMNEVIPRYDRVFDGISGVSNWDSNGKTRRFHEKQLGSLLFGGDLQRDDGMCASVFTCETVPYESSVLRIIIWNEL